MNIQSGKFKNTRRSGSANGSVGEKLSAVFKIGVLLLLLGAVFNGYIFLNQKIVETERNIRKTEQMIEDAERDIKQLLIQREQLSTWSYIREGIIRYNLGLREPMPGQVESLQVLSRRQAANTEVEMAVRQLPPGQFSRVKSN